MNRYDTVPAALPSTLPAVTRAQGCRIARAIINKFWPANTHASYWASCWGRTGRRVWISTKPTAASNSAKGVGRIVHDVSHEVFSAVYPTRKPHDPLHAKYEADIAAYVAANLHRWVVDAPVKPKLSAAERRMRQYSRNNVALHRWDAKLRRAQNAMRKLRTANRRIERANAAEARAARPHGFLADLPITKLER